MTNSSQPFKKEFSFEKRQKEAEKINTKYPDRVPLVVEKGNKRDDIPDIDKRKFLVPKDLTVGQMIYIVRKRIKIAPEKALFIFVNGTMPATHASVDEIYEKHQDEDGFSPVPPNLTGTGAEDLLILLDT